MKKFILGTLVASILATSINAYDSDYPAVCASVFDEAIEAKGTPLQDEKWHIFTSCVDAIEEGEDRVEVKSELEKREPFCYSLTGAFIGQDDPKCTVPNWYKGRR